MRCYRRAAATATHRHHRPHPDALTEKTGKFRSVAKSEGAHHDDVGEEERQRSTNCDCTAAGLARAAYEVAIRRTTLRSPQEKAGLWEGL